MASTSVRPLTAEDRFTAFTPPTVDELLAQRGVEYGQAWRATGEILKMLNGTHALDRLLDSVHSYNWVTILCKLIRLLANPNHLDSWQDIAGYAKLSAEHIKGNGAE